MNWKETLNGALTRATGYELQRAGGGAAKRPLRAGDRLIEAPVFVMCTLRSGSTLLRVLLDSHSQIHCPHEIHLRYVSVHFDEKWSERSMKEMGLDPERLEYLLWDRILHRELAASGKPQHRRQDAQRRLHRRPHQGVLAGRALDLPAPPPGGDRPLAPGVPGEDADEARTST